MDFDSISRRGALRATLALGVGACATRVACAQGKLAKDAVKYVDKGDVPGKDCDDCMQFVAAPDKRSPATCRIVEGAISPQGHCVAFTPRPKG